MEHDEKPVLASSKKQSSHVVTDAVDEINAETHSNSDDDDIK